jgi:Bacterial Ig domain/Excalibur calcium-binding domain
VHTPCLTLTGVSCGALLAAVLATPAFAAAAPVARDDNYQTPVNTNLVIGAPGVLGNDTDADGDPLAAQLVAGAQHGNVSVAGNGAFTYVPTTNYVGPDQFTYRACEVLTPVVLQTRQLEAPGCDTATVFITVKGAVPAPTTTTVPPPPVGGGRPVYPNCKAAFDAGVSDILRGDPRYRLPLDRDRDGIACEKNGDDTNPPVTVVKPPPTTIVTQPPATNTIVQQPPAAPPNVIVMPPAQPPANTFITPQAPSNGAVATGDGSLA